MRLYNFRLSPNSIKVWAVIHHLGLEMQHEEVVFGEEPTMASDHYGELNPNRRMPTLVDGDFSLWESNAIMQYLAHKAGARDLWPEEPRAQADVSRWQCWQLAHWSRCTQPFLYENVVKKLFGMGAPDAAELEEATQMFHKFAPVLEQHLASRSWLVGDGPGLADYSVGAPLVYADAAGMPWEGYPNLRAWYGRLSALDCWRKACPPKPAVTG